MVDEVLPTTRALIRLHAVEPEPEWQPIFHRSNQVVLYNPTSHALAIRHSSHFAKHSLALLCPYCNNPINRTPDDIDTESEHSDSSSGIHSRVSDYFQLLAISNQTSSRPSTPPNAIGNGSESARSGAFPAEMMAEGYFQAFFQEEGRLGMGANGSVYLCQHVLDGTPLGHFAVKKIAVGESHSYLLKILREVRLLEKLHHPNIITYHHAWLETCQFSLFGPKVPTLHVLMQWAEGGSLDDFIDIRQGRASNKYHVDHLAESHPFDTPSVDSAKHFPGPSASPPPTDTRSARIRAFRMLHRAAPEDRERLRRAMNADPDMRAGDSGAKSWTPVHLLSAEEVRSLFGDVVGGLAFLHHKAILHLDLKPGNVLLTWDERKLVPRAMLSDFGTSRDMIYSSRNRSGNTGTLEYASPESLPSPETGLLQQVDSKADMWSLGMILHKLLFFRLPYRYAADGDALEGGNSGADVEDSVKMARLEKEVLNYTGFESNQSLVTAFTRRRLPRTFLVLLESLLNVVPSSRPSCERVSSAIREGKLDPLSSAEQTLFSSQTSLLPVVRRQSDASPPGPNMDHAEDDRILGSETIDEDGGADEQVHVMGDLIQRDAQQEEKFAPLGLPAPNDQSGRWGRLDRFGLASPRMLWVRSVKSTLLLFKAFSIASICRDSYTWFPLSFILLFVAVVDTWSDELWVSVFLGAIHLAVVRFWCSRNRCCV